MYDITIVSPRNYFLYTPLLPTCTMGSVEERSIVTPIRRLINGKAEYIEATCEHIDTVEKVIRCSRPGLPKNRADQPNEHDSKITFFLNYDILVYAVGAQTNDFGCPGVKEHAFFFKEIQDARRVRERISDNFEQASLPSVTEEEKAALLSFVIVGGGPTGVEVAADLADFVQNDVAELYPKLFDYVKIRLVNVGQNLLATYDRGISARSKEVFESKGVEVLNGYRVTEVTADLVRMEDKQGQVLELPFGCIVWAAGNKDHPLTAQLKASLVEKNVNVSELNVKSLQAKDKGIITDEWLQVRGSGGEIFAIGDAAAVRHDRTVVFAERLFKEADVQGDGAVDMAELRDLFHKAYSDFPQLEEYAEYLEDTYKPESKDDPRAAAIASIFESATKREQRAWKQAYELAQQRVGSRTARKGPEGVAADLKDAGILEGPIDLEGFKALLKRVDENLRPFPATAQVAAQQGSYLAKLFAAGHLDGRLEGFRKTAQAGNPFTYFHKGSLAYLGDGEAGFDLPVIGPITGPAAGLAWKLYETIAQLSWKNRALVGLDWLRTEVFGRDTSRL